MHKSNDTSTVNVQTNNTNNKQTCKINILAICNGMLYKQYTKEVVRSYEDYCTNEPL